jgi:N-methylhydantoinase B
VERIPNVTFHGHGLEFPTADGLFGGYPGSTNQIWIKRRSNLGQLFAQGILPRTIEELDGVDEVPKPISRSFLDRGDVCHFSSCGGGGYGDPIERDPEKVARDVASGLVSRQWAEQLYAVCFQPLSSLVDVAATEKKREEVRHNRRRRSSHSRVFSPSGLPQFFGALMRVNANLSIVQSSDGATFRCRCGELLARAEENFKEYLAWAEMPCSAAGPYTTAAPEFVLRELYCPACYVLLEVDVVEKGEAISKEVELKLS